MENEKTVSIIIVNWNQKGLLETCLSSLWEKTSYSNYKVIVVDNGSSDGSADFVRQSFPWADILALNRNYGFSIGNNRGIIFALKNYNPQYILLLNNDTQIVQADWLTKMVAVAESEANVGIVGCKLIYPNGKIQYIGTKVTVKGLSWLKPSSLNSLPEVFEVDAALGACFLIKRQVIDKIGFLDAWFSPFVHEESDFCMRAKKAGYKTLLVSSVSVVHFWKASVGKVKSAYVEYVVRRNAIRFMLLNFPASWLLKRVPIEVRIFVGCFIARNKGARGILPIKLRTGRELLVRLKVNRDSWWHNLRNLKEILAKRANRAARVEAIE